jgi:hypothetical protein
MVQWILSGGLRVCDLALDADTFANSDTYLICVIGSGEGIYFWTGQLPGRRKGTLPLWKRRRRLCRVYISGFSKGTSS